MTNYFINHTNSLTLSQKPATLTSLLFLTLSTGKRAPSQPVLPGQPSIDDYVHGTEKLLLNIKKVRILYSEVNLLIRVYYIIVQDRDGPNINILFYFIFTCRHNKMQVSKPLYFEDNY